MRKHIVVTFPLNVEQKSDVQFIEARDLHNAFRAVRDTLVAIEADVHINDCLWACPTFDILKVKVYSVDGEIEVDFPTIRAIAREKHKKKKYVLTVRWSGIVKTTIHDSEALAVKHLRSVSDGRRISFKIAEAMEVK